MLMKGSWGRRERGLAGSSLWDHDSVRARRSCGLCRYLEQIMCRTAYSIQHKRFYIQRWPCETVHLAQQRSPSDE